MDCNRPREGFQGIRDEDWVSEPFLHKNPGTGRAAEERENTLHAETARELELCLLLRE